jgi:phage shock protein E
MNWLGKLFSEVPLEPAPAFHTNALVVDVRNPTEFASAHVEGAVNLPIKKFGKSYASVVRDKARQIVVYGDASSRSDVATQFLKLQRYTNVIDGQSATEVAGHLNRKIV